VTNRPCVTAGLPGASINATGTSPRGIKRSRSPDQYSDALGEGDDAGTLYEASLPVESTRTSTKSSAFEQTNTESVADQPQLLDEQKRRKRGRPPKPRTSGGTASTSPLAAPSQQPHLPSSTSTQIQTPRINAESLPQQTKVTPTQTKSSPPAKTTPAKPLVKALPTVRDHTTDQLGPEQDEYIPREYDEAGETKVDAMGHPQDGRTYRCRTFYVPKRGQKLFMLATECARVLGYRDSYLLFNKNRSLYKIIATQAEKDDLISQDVLPYSYRSRQIAIVTAKSMFRQFGSRLINNGRRVRDDYWESKARKQGFTEEDLAGEKRPGAAKARDAAAAEAANAGSLQALGHGDVIYSNGPHLEGLQPPQAMPPGLGGIPSSLQPLPMIHLAPTDDPRMRDFANIPRSRHEMAGAPYQDRTQPSPATEILNQASHTAEFNKILNQQRDHRGKYLQEYWNRPREVPVSTPLQPPAQSDTIGGAIQAVPSPQISSTGMMNQAQQPAMSHGQSQMMAAQGYSQQPHQQNPLTQSPIRGVPQSVRPDQLQHRSSGLSLGSTGAPQSSPYGYPGQSQMWGQPPQPQQSPMTAHPGLPQYTTHVQQQPSPHPSQSPHHPSPQLQQQQSSGSMPGGMNFGGMPGTMAAAYPSMSARGLYQSGQNPQQFMPQTTGGQPPSMPGWAGQQAQQSPHAPWSGY
jgi:hypothetical protein